MHIQDQTQNTIAELAKTCGSDDSHMPYGKMRFHTLPIELNVIQSTIDLRIQNESHLSKEGNLFHGTGFHFVLTNRVWIPTTLASLEQQWQLWTNRRKDGNYFSSTVTLINLRCCPGKLTASTGTSYLLCLECFSEAFCAHVCKRTSTFAECIPLNWFSAPLADRTLLPYNLKRAPNFHDLAFQSPVRHL